MCDASQLEMDYQELLKILKNTVEGLLISQVANVWNVYGGLNRLHNAMDRIFKHRCKLQPNGEPDYMTFIQGLNWLLPNPEMSSITTDSEYQPQVPVHLKSDKASIWLYRSLENHTLSQKLSWLLSDKKHVLSCYEADAFLYQETYSEAALICLRAVEQYRPSLLSEINPHLFLYKFGTKEFIKTHRRSISFPESTRHDWNVRHSKSTGVINENIDNESDNKLNIDTEQSHSKNNKIDKTEQLSVGNQDFCSEAATNKKIRHLGKLKPWNSLTNLKIESSSTILHNPRVIRCATMPNTPSHYNNPQRKLSPSVLKIDYSKLKFERDSRRSNTAFNEKGCTFVKSEKASKPVRKASSLLVKLKSDNSVCVDDRTSVLSMPIKKTLKSSFWSSSVPDYSFLPLSGERDVIRSPKKSFIEDGGNSILPMATGYFPRPLEGQSLTSFLTSGQFSRANGELDRENAHFSICDVMISVIEQVKFNRKLRLEEEQVDDSDEEINHLQQRIRMRRKQKREEKQRKIWEKINYRIKTDASDHSSEATVTPRSESPVQTTESRSTDEIDDIDVDSASNIADSRSVSLMSLYSEADVLRRPRGAPDGQSDICLSAEGVALSLIAKFNDRQLPKASELEWLVSENDDVPQDLLPLPNSWPVNPDMDESFSSSPSFCSTGNTPLRGTADWAPPRAQIIFTIHPPPVRRTLMAKQNYRCAGCGMRVAPEYASKFRYCDYLGRYFCTGCHANQLALIPGRMLFKWDFNRYSVSNFSYKLLDRMSADPLFNVQGINHNLYRKSKQLEKCYQTRLQLFYIKDFIKACRFAANAQELLQQEQAHLISEPDVYSMNDLLSVKRGDLIPRLKDLLDLCVLHISKCQLCQARGFLCEKCQSKNIIYPWQLNKVSRCSKCGACYHFTCWKPNSLVPCARCNRLKLRRESRDT